MIAFTGFGTLTWDLAKYPVEGIVVTKVIAAADEALRHTYVLSAHGTNFSL